MAAKPVLRWNESEPNRCPNCHIEVEGIRRSRPWRVYTCCGCFFRFTRYPRMAWLLPYADIRCRMAAHEKPPVAAEPWSRDEDGPVVLDRATIECVLLDHADELDDEQGKVSPSLAEPAYVYREKTGFDAKVEAGRKLYPAGELDVAIPPGETLAELLEERGMTLEDLQAKTGLLVDYWREDLIPGRIELSPYIAGVLEAALGTPARLWLAMETAYRAALKRGVPNHVASAEVVELTPEEYQQAVQNALDGIGCTTDELAEMARRDDYPTPQHRKVWLAIKPEPEST